MLCRAFQQGSQRRQVRWRFVDTRGRVSCKLSRVRCYIDAGFANPEVHDYRAADEIKYRIYLADQPRFIKMGSATSSKGLSGARQTRSVSPICVSITRRKPRLND